MHWSNLTPKIPNKKTEVTLRNPMQLKILVSMKPIFSSTTCLHLQAKQEGEIGWIAVWKRLNQDSSHNLWKCPSLFSSDWALYLWDIWVK